MDTVIMGIGNPILSDDGAGIKIAQFIGKEKPDLRIIETCEGGLALLDHMVDCERLIVIDSIKTDHGKVGELFKIDLEDLKSPTDMISHGIDLASALEIGAGIGYCMPKSVSIYAINVVDNTNFKEGCTRDIEKKIPGAARQIISKEKL